MLRKGVVTAFAMFVLTSCTENPGPTELQDKTTPPASRDLNVAPPRGSDDRGEFPASSRFGLELRVSGDLSPGSPVHLQWSVESRLNSPQVDISIILPDVEAAKMSGWGNDFRVSLELRPARAYSWQGALREGESKSGEVGLTIPAPGYYRAVLSVSSPDGPEDPAKINQLNSASEKVWILIDDRGGVVTDRFQGERIPAPFLPVPGPRRTRISSEPMNEAGVFSNLFSEVVALFRRALGLRRTSTVPLKAIYYHDLDQVWYPVKEAFWTVQHLEQVGRDWEVVGTESNFTGSFGTFHIQCTADRYQGHLEIRTPQVRMLQAGNPYFEGDTSDDCNSATYITIDAIYDEEAHTMMGIDSLADQMESYLGQYRDRLDVQLYQYPDTVCFYERIEDQIHWYDGRVWLTGHYDWVKAHEFAHALHHEAMGEIPSGYDCDNGTPGHHFYTVEDFECAYAEGLADYLGSAITGIYESYFESNDAWGIDGEDGSIIEGPVASFFLDLTDSAAEAHDSITFPPSYVAAIVETCEVNGGTDADGIDHLIYCFENQIDSLVTNDPDYFPQRSSDPSSYSESATEPNGWSWSVIRAIWVKNLYNGG